MRSSNSDVPGLQREAEGEESEVRLKSPASRPASFLSGHLAQLFVKISSAGDTFCQELGMETELFPVLGLNLSLCFRFKGSFTALLSLPPFPGLEQGSRGSPPPSLMTLPNLFGAILK